MSFPKTLLGDKVTSLVATAAGMATVWSISMLRPDIIGFTVTIAASLIAFIIGRAFSSRNPLASMLPFDSRTGFYQTAPVTIRKRPRWLVSIPACELNKGNFLVEDWQHGEYA